MIDLPQPTEGMRRAITAAAVGDNCYREDPTVQALEETTAEILGKEAALDGIATALSRG